MNLTVTARAIWRFKWISLGGFVLACLLAVFATARVSFAGGVPKLSYRTPVIYTAATKNFVTQAGFPWGRTTLPSSPTASGGSSSIYADPSRLVMLAGVYATLANGAGIQQRLVHPAEGEALIARPEVDPQTGAALPLIDLISLAPSPQRAVAIATQASSMLERSVEAQQKDAGIPTTQRVLLQNLQQPYRVTIASGRKKTVPIVVFMTVLLAAIGLILALENIRPRVRLGEVGEFLALRTDAAHESAPSRMAG